MKERKRFEDGERSCQKAVMIWRKLRKEYAREPRYRAELAQSIDELGNLCTIPAIYPLPRTRSGRPVTYGRS